MKINLLALGLATVVSANLFAGETLNLKLVPERGWFVRHLPQEVVIKIDLSAIADRKKARRTPLNLAVVLDRSGSMTGAKIEKAKQAAMLARRDKPGREGKVSAPLADLAGTIEKLLIDIHQSLYDKALAFRRANTHEAKTYDEFKQAVETGFAYAHWCGSGECEEKVKEETRATMRCIPLDQAAVLGNGGGAGSGTCVYCNKPAKERAIFARAY